MIPSSDLKKVLQEGTWMDTNVMYYYFEILRDGCDTCFIVDLSICVSTLLSKRSIVVSVVGSS